MISLLRRRAGGAVQPIMTARLRLVPMTRALVQAESVGVAQVGRELGCEVAGDWPPEHWEPHVYAHILTQLTNHPETVGYHRYMVLADEPALLVGTLGAFPCAAGDVELGYSVVASQQRKGLGTEAVRAQVAWLLHLPAVHSVSAQTFRTMPQSIKVMERCGLLPAGEGDEPGTVRYRRWK